ncbi:response regulator transcription factor [Candidatus Nephthysia bennettiae]|uniref:Response regulator transcription factor n=1 Tax=Candidatus Nephthysia bennettiae TaxID=3127016 RepID=A0A934N8K6_9BACT|nr:response regulator transcription factor [Candidatus Dormibacteraeota bacterium]MBJ7611910.1 response regulator transcription factor [Candidatus Dormibacteraeota bacterium]
MSVTRAKTILVSADLLHLVSRSLVNAGFEVAACPDLERTPLDGAAIRIGDALVWDPFGVPGNLEAVCRKVREQVQVPILALSSHGEACERVLVMEAGIDSCLTLPIHVDELVARVRALLRRSARPVARAAPSLAAGDLEIDVTRHQVWHGGSSIPLRPREFALVVELVRHANQVVSRDLLLDRVWGLRGAYHRTVDVHIVHLREKLSRAGVREPRILTVRGVGYCLALRGGNPAEGAGEVVLTPMAWPWLQR